MDDVKVLVADDQRLVREGIASLLNIQEGISVVGMAVDGLDAVQQALDLVPDVVLMDVQMPVMDGIAATKEIRQKLMDCQVLMLTTFDDDEYILKSLQAGASGYLLKDIPADDLAQAVRLTHAGIYQMAPSVVGKLVGHLVTHKEVSESKSPVINVDLTDREMDVLRLVATGATNKEIAEALFVSEGTVKNHVSSILSQLGLRDRLQAALFAHEHNLI